MITTKNFHPAVLIYLEQLELELKRLSGVVPEDALCDAREFLTEDANALQRSGEPPNENEHFRWISERFGEPAIVAQQYADHANPLPVQSGYAPGWRICCTTCGRSAPLASIGAIRIGAKSWHKYKVGYCRGCNGLRFLRILQDLDKTNLIDLLGLQGTPAELRSTMHHPIATIVGILIAVLLSMAVVWAIMLAILFWAL